MKKLFKFITIVFLVLTITPAFADDLQDGLKAYEREDYATAYEIFKMLAKQGDSTAQYKLGILYSEGLGVLQSYLAAHMWFNLAGANGVEDARVKRDIVEKLMTSVQVAAAQKLAMDFRVEKDAAKETTGELLQLFSVEDAFLVVSTRKSKDAEWEKTKSKIVPLIPDNTCYEWVILLKTSLRFMYVKEVFSFPSKPEFPEFPNGYILSNDGLSMSKDLVKTVENNAIMNTWCVSEGDPSGEHEIDIFAEGKLLHKFKFTVGQNPATTPAPLIETKVEKGLSESDSKNLDDLTKYLSGINTIFKEFVDVINLIGDVDLLSSSLVDEKITSDYAADNKNLLFAKVQIKLDAFNNNLSQLQAPKFNSSYLKSLTKDVDSYIQSLPDVISRTLDLSKKQFNAASKGDLVAYTKYDMASRQSTMAMLEGENYVLSLQKSNLEPTTPTYAHYSIMQHFNRVLINIGKAYMSDYFKDEPLNEMDYLTRDSQAYIKVAELELKEGEKIIEDGEELRTEHLKKIKKEYAQFPKVQIFFESISDISRKWFENESKVGKVLHLLIEDHPLGENSDKLNVVLQELFDQRLDLQNESVELISTLNK